MFFLSECSPLISIFVSLYCSFIMQKAFRTNGRAKTRTCPNNCTNPTVAKPTKLRKAPLPPTADKERSLSPVSRPIACSRILLAPAATCMPQEVLAQEVLTTDMLLARPFTNRKEIREEIDSKNRKLHCITLEIENIQLSIDSTTNQLARVRNIISSLGRHSRIDQKLMDRHFEKIRSLTLDLSRLATEYRCAILARQNSDCFDTSHPGRSMTRTIEF